MAGTARKAAPRKAAPRKRPAIHAVQSEVEGVASEVIDDGTTELNGERFKLADAIGMMPLLRYAHAAARGLDTDTMEGMAAVYEMLRDCIDETDWLRFQDHATVTKADGDDLLPVINDAVEKISARPTSRPGRSLPGPRKTSPSSKATSSSPATPHHGPSPEELAALTPVADLTRH